ncbi:hypothetical protein U1Q18_031397, partial [Sarracenia purpurea var. burkii]
MGEQKIPQFQCAEIPSCDISTRHQCFMAGSTFHDGNSLIRRRRRISTKAPNQRVRSPPKTAMVGGTRPPRQSQQPRPSTAATQPTPSSAEEKLEEEEAAMAEHLQLQANRFGPPDHRNQTPSTNRLRID